MECEDRHLVDFEVVPVITSAQAVERVAPRL
jgi:siroheme synthase